MVATHLDTESMHEHVVVRRGVRSGLPIVVAVHSTALGQAIGGCRLAHYPHWRDGLTDALRLSAAMSDKCALAGLPNGGGKTVVALPPGRTLDAAARRAVLHDAGDVIAGLDGAYATGPDVGTGPDDMVTVAERTPHAFCRPVQAGGSGDSSGHTAVGVLAALHALCAERFGSAEMSARSFAVLGLGRVGGHVLRMLADAGATLVVSDIDEGRRTLADSVGAAWASPQDCLTADVDVLVPAALGGLLTPHTVPTLRCAAIAGPANNQLDTPATADLLHQRGILWAPDIIVSAGGIIHATAVELHQETSAQATARVHGIADTLTDILRTAHATGSTPAAAARSRARQRIEHGRRRPCRHPTNDQPPPFSTQPHHRYPADPGVQPHDPAHQTRDRHPCRPTGRMGGQRRSRTRVEPGRATAPSTGGGRRRRIRRAHHRAAKRSIIALRLRRLGLVPLLNKYGHCGPS